MTSREHRMTVRVYYGDTDAAGVVYYANYLRYVEGSRYEFIQAAGVDLAAWQEKGFVFAVADLSANYRRPAKLGDEIEIRTRLERSTPATLAFYSAIHRVPDETLLFTACVRAACLTPDGKPKRIPKEIRAKLAS